MAVKIFRLSAVVLFVLTLGFALGLYLPQAQLQLKTWQRALGGDHHLHLLAGCLIPLSLAMVGRLYSYSTRTQAAAWLVCLSLFALDEYVQRFSVYRSSNFEDFCYSAGGWGVGLLTYVLMLNSFRRRQK